MGYSTRFTGKISVRPRLNDHEIAFLRRFADTRHMERESGPYYCDPDGDDETDVLDPDEPGPGQPGLWCHWEPTDDGRSIRWNKAEKFYEPAKWMAYVIRTFLMPGAALATELADPVPGRHYPPEFEHFTFDHVCDGVLKALGDEPDDRWALHVEGGQVYVQRKGEQDREGPITDTSNGLHFVQVLLVGGPHDSEVHSAWAPFLRNGLRLLDGTRYVPDPAAPAGSDEAGRGRILHFQPRSADALVDEAVLDRLSGYVTDLETFDRKARAAMRAELAEENSTVRLYVEHHRDVPALQHAFADDEEELEAFLSALSLVRVGLNVGTDGPNRETVFDYTIGAEHTQYLIAVAFGEDGEVGSVAMES